MEVSTSLLSIKEDAVRIFYDLEVAGTNYYHIDVMDGKFVEANTTERMLEYATTLSHITNLGLDVHLMCEDIEKYVDDYIMLEPDTITFHVEVLKSKEQAMNIINDIKSNGVKVGISLNPNTKLDAIYEYLPYIHKVLVMTVVPGKGGQNLIPETIEKIKKLKNYIELNNLETIIEADGGINKENVEALKNAGVEIVVAGTYIISSDNMKEAILSLK
ncbi:MAG: ribulose-phosphate 3-epimerase [Clostridia bacterium]|nr:ribulose-phosphate 3-epimerase [Clostridia bacterium]